MARMIHWKRKWQWRRFLILARCLYFSVMLVKWLFIYVYRYNFFFFFFFHFPSRYNLPWFEIEIKRFWYTYLIVVLWRTKAFWKSSYEACFHGTYQCICKMWTNWEGKTGIFCVCVCVCIILKCVCAWLKNLFLVLFLLYEFWATLFSRAVNCFLYSFISQVVSDKLIPAKNLNEIKSVLIQALATHGQLSDALSMYEEIKQSGFSLEPKAVIGLIVSF